MRITVHRSPARAASAVVHHLAQGVRARPALVLGLATGRTTIPLYARLTALVRAGQLDLSHVTTFNLDEFWGLPATDPGSYRSFMETQLFGPAGISPTRVNFLDGTAVDAAGECARYEAAIAAAGGIDLQVLGIGANGHIGFNEPASALQPRTHLARLKPQTRRANAALFGHDTARVPALALSMGMATILQARAIVLVATGRAKRRAVAAAVRGPLTTRVPASFLQVHPDVEIVMDEAAAQGLV